MLSIRFASFALLVATVACSGSAERRVADADDFGDTLLLTAFPQRIVSLNPATTDLLFALGAGDRVVGRTHWDLYPEEAQAVADLGSGLRPNVESVLGVKPDLVILYASVDNRAAARQLRAAGVQTLSLKIDRIADFYEAARLIGRVTGDSARGVAVADSVRRTIDAVRRETASLPKIRVFWHIWDAPLITIGSGSYMNELIEIAGAENVYADVPESSPTVSIEDVMRRNPAVMITGPESSKRIAADPRWAELAAVKSGHVVVADTTLVGRPSVRLGEAAVSLARLLHPGQVH